MNSDQGDSSSSLTGILIIIIDGETHHLFPSLIFTLSWGLTSPMWHTEAFVTALVVPLQGSRVGLCISFILMPLDWLRQPTKPECGVSVRGSVRGVSSVTIFLQCVLLGDDVW